MSERPRIPTVGFMDDGQRASQRMLTDSPRLPLPSPVEMGNFDENLDKIAAAAVQSAVEPAPSQAAWVNEITTSAGKRRQMIIQSVEPLDLDGEKRQKFVEATEALFAVVKDMLPEKNGTFSYTISV